MPRGNSEPGPFRSSRTPYLQQIYEAVLNAGVRRIVGVMGSQMSKTELLLNLMGHKLDDDPGPIIFVGASQRQVESISTSRVSPMLRTTPSLAAKIDTRKTVDKVTEKVISGQRLGFAWAGSAIELSSHPAELVLIDERDRMGSDVDGEGDVVALAEARVSTYPNGKIVVTSSPTIDGGSPIWTLWQNGTAAKWSWPCPHCETYFVPTFDLLKWPKGCTPQRAKREARVMCPSCAALIEDKHKSTMNAAGKYEITGDADSDTASFWVSGLASPWRPWGVAAQRWLEAHKSGEPEQRQAVINTIFGELFALAGEAPAAAAVHALRGGYAMDEIPAGVSLLTAGVDMQMDRLVYVVRGWGHGSTSWLIRHGELWGDTSQEDVWQQLGNLLEFPFGGRRIRLTFVDSGYRPDAAYRFARKYLTRAYPSKGHDSREKPVNISKLDVKTNGQSQRRGVSLAHVDSSYFKTWIHSRIAWPLDQPGAWHLPHDATDDYCAQIIAESRIVKPNGTVRWVKTKTANHFLDAEVLAAAAAHLLNVHLLKRKASDPAVDSSSSTAPAAPSKAPKPNPPGRPGWDAPSRRPGGGGRNWVKNW